MFYSRVAIELPSGPTTISATPEIDRLPAELLAVIFEERNPLNDITQIPDFIPMAITFASVCSKWRAVALSTPFLWACLQYFASHSSRFNTELIKVVLARSKSYPWCLHIGWAVDFGKDILDIISPHL